MNVTDYSWLLLVFRLPARRASLRVQVWRQLRRVGALPLQTSGYLLPDTPANRERFEWLAALLRRSRGSASVVRAQSVDDLPGAALAQRFLEARGRDYSALLRELQAAAGSSKGVSPARLTRFRRRLQDVAAIDFFDNPLRSRVEALLDRAATGGGQPAPSAAPRRKDYRHRTWVTRPRPGIDRVSSAWLIRRFVDPRAKFVFANDAPRHGNAVPFDMFQAAAGGFGHRGEDCTFETLRKEFRIADARVRAIGEIVHDADIGDEKFARREGYGLDRVLIGWAQQGVSDQELLRRGMELIEGLYQSLK